MLKSRERAMSPATMIADIQDKMKYESLGNTGLLVSRLCLGAMTFGDGQGPFKAIGAVGQKEADTLVNATIEGGINFFDTASGYGDSERLLGRALACLNAEAVVATKCGPFSSAQLALPRSHLQAEITMQLRRSAARSSAA